MSQKILATILASFLVLTVRSGLAQGEKDQEEGGFFKNLKDRVTDVFKKKDPLEPLCLNLDESYQIADNAKSLAAAAGSLKLKQTFQNVLSGRSVTDTDIQGMMRKLSLQYVWVPIPIETQIGSTIHNSEVNQKRIIRREAAEKNLEVKELYEKADSAFEAALTEFDPKKMPYAMSLYLVRVDDEINAEALPAGYMYVTRAAVNSLSDEGLKFVLGHEIAHVAKRHTSKELQQRMIDLGLATKVFERVMHGAPTDDLSNIFGGEKIIEVFQSNFAKYLKGQELQADGCSARSLAALRVDAPAGFKDYSEKRGKEKKEPVPSPADAQPVPVLPFAFTPLTDHSSHPEDERRLENVQAAYRHHREKKR